MAENNMHTKKQFGDKFPGIKSPTLPTKDVGYSNSPGRSVGQLANYEKEKFGEPMNPGAPARIGGLEGLYDDIGEKSGFITEGYLDKGGTPFGEAAKFNFLPPGMDISNQENTEIHDMPLRKLTAESYPGDGWKPSPRDVPE